MKNYRLLGLLAMGPAAVVNSGNASAPERKPNIVFILADDLGWKDLACYGNKYTETPNIDSLARSGMLFTQAYAACPVSSPTRASILTGKYPARLGITNFLTGNRTDPDSQVLPAKWKPYLEAREVTMAEIFRQNGYFTGMVGKWHLGSHDSIAPWSQGFDYSRVIGKNGLDYYNYSIFEDSYKKEFIDNGDEYLTDKLTDYGIGFLKAAGDKPFLLYMAYSAPHVVIVPRPDKLMKYFRKYASAEEKFNPYYSAMVESLDDGVGRLVAELRRKGVLENTIIVFTSDNGGLGLDELGPVPTSNEPLRKWKGHVYEGGIRVPAIVSWQGHIRPSSVPDFYFSTVDYLPTLCEAAGIYKLPKGIDGKSILAVLEGLGPDDNDRPLYWHYPHFSNQMGRPGGAVRKGDYKLVQMFESAKPELYNLKEDISEQKDLSSELPAKVAELYILLESWRKEVKAEMPLNYIPVKY